MDSEILINTLRDDIIEICRPLKIYLFSQKQNPSGDFCAVKLCVIIPDGDSRLVERQLYVEVESDVAFDVLVYTAEEWENLLKTEMSFAAHIEKTGRVLYAAD